MKKEIFLPAVIIITGLMIATAIYIITSENYRPPVSRQSQNHQAETTDQILPVNIADHILGNPNAPIKIIEYADFSCSYCAQYQQTLHRIINDYGPTGNVAWVFREFPLPSHPNALQEAQTAQCVAKTAGNDTFWKFADILFANQPIKETQLGEYVHRAGANPTKVALCVSDNITNKRILAQRKNAEAIGVNGIPYTVILTPKGIQMSFISAAPYSYLQQHLNAIMVQDGIISKAK